MDIFDIRSFGKGLRKTMDYKNEIKNTNQEDKFNNFKHSSFYDDEEAMDKLEKKLLGWDD